MPKLLIHPKQMLLFAGLSLVDLVLTWWLLTRCDDAVYESNPVAQWCLETLGWLGLAAFKAGMVVLVVGLAFIISRSKPRLGGGVLALGCAALLAVVSHSLVLAWTVSHETDAVTLAALQKQEELAEDLQELYERRDFMDRLCQRLMSGKCTLEKAVSDMLSFEDGENSGWLFTLYHMYPGRPVQECVARNLLVQTLDFYLETGSMKEGRRIMRRLEIEFQNLYGVSPAEELRSLETDFFESNIS